MGTHPIFESDFDCLTVFRRTSCLVTNCFRNRFTVGSQFYQSVRQMSSTSTSSSSSSDGELDSEIANMGNCMSQMKIEGGYTWSALLEDISEDKFKNIIILTGAGISTSAGIPDFRTKGTGLYDNLQEYNLPYAEAVFDINYFRNKPQAFYTLAKEIMPGKYAPTLTHHFIKYLHDKEILLRCYTQNIDGLERLAGLDDEKLVEAHGTFATSRCIKCRCFVEKDIIDKALMAGEPLQCSKKKCNGWIKPDIVFFGEGLPERFHNLIEQDFHKCDLCITMGTSLYVQPFASLPNYVGKECKRVLINRERVGNFKFNDPTNKTDVFYKGNADDGCIEMALSFGFEEEMKKSFEDLKKKISNNNSDVQTKQQTVSEEKNT